MATISIIYFSGTGNTAKFTEWVAKGASEVPETEVHVIRIDENDIVKGRYKNDDVLARLTESDAIIFGSPTYMAGISAQFKAFADATIGIWVGQQWKDKLAAGYTVSGSVNGDKLGTLQYLQAFAMEHGMAWIGTGELPSQPNGLNRLGSWIGAMAHSTDNPEAPIVDEDKLTGEVFGKRVAAFLKKLA